MVVVDLALLEGVKLASLVLVDLALMVAVELPSLGVSWQR